MREVVIAEFASVEALLRGARRARDLGYANVEAYTPFMVPELDDVLAIRRTRAIPALTFLAGAGGAMLALLIQWWTNAYDYPLDVGGRPTASWPTYVVIIFETTVLFASLVAFASTFLTSRLPRLHDPVFDLPGIERTTVDRFWVTIADPDPTGDDVAEEELGDLRAALEESGALTIRDVRRAE